MINRRARQLTSLLWWKFPWKPAESVFVMPARRSLSISPRKTAINEFLLRHTKRLTSLITKVACSLSVDTHRRVWRQLRATGWLASRDSILFFYRQSTLKLINASQLLSASARCRLAQRQSDCCLSPDGDRKSGRWLCSFALASRSRHNENLLAASLRQTNLIQFPSLLINRHLSSCAYIKASFGSTTVAKLSLDTTRDVCICAHKLPIN